ncbi:hypothetical protein WDU94_004722 [Cyamophila willieti]
MLYEIDETCENPEHSNSTNSNSIPHDLENNDQVYHNNGDVDYNKNELKLSRDSSFYTADDTDKHTLETCTKCLCETIPPEEYDTHINSPEDDNSNVSSDQDLETHHQVQNRNQDNSNVPKPIQTMYPKKINVGDNDNFITDSGNENVAPKRDEDDACDAISIHKNLNISASGKSAETIVPCTSHCCSDPLTSSLNEEMIQKLMDIKIKWKHLCENITDLNENKNSDEINNLFQSIGLNLDTPIVKTKKEPPKTVVSGELVKSIQEVMNLGTKAVENQETYSQVYVNYKKNKNMIPGIQTPLHRVMSTIFDPNKLQIQHMKKWLDVDNRSKRFVCGMEGVMSIVHAFSMKNELFALKNGVKNNSLEYGPYDGLADIIWQAGDRNSAIVVEYEPQFTHTRLFECLDAKKCFNINEVRFQLASVYATPQPPISLILSVILTRGLDRVQADLSYSKMKTLLTQDGDETWSLILLLLIGQAVGHVMHSQFPKNWNPVRSPIGILSLDEYGEKVYVSPFFKTPRFPLWLIHYCHDGNHYSLLFGHCKQLLSDWKEEKNFMLHHWDFDNEEMKSVQIRTTGRITQDPDEVKDVLEMIVRTKWPIANIDIKSSVGNEIAVSADQFPSLKERLFSRYSEKTK